MRQASARRTRISGSSQAESVTRHYFEAIGAHADHYRLALTRFRPTATIGADGSVIVDLGAPNA